MFDMDDEDDAGKPEGCFPPAVGVAGALDMPLPAGVAPPVPPLLLLADGGSKWVSRMLAPDIGEGPW